MDEQEWLAKRFEEERPQLRAVAFRLLGSPTEADDAVQEAWLRLSRVEASAIENLGAWLTTVVGRVALNMLRARRSRHEEPMDSPIPEIDGEDPEHEALIAEWVGLAMIVVLETLTPAQRIALVLHDFFAEPFEEIGAILDCTPKTARQLASRARRRVRGAGPVRGGDPSDLRRVAEAFFAAARKGDFEALLAVLDPHVVLRVVTGPGRVEKVHGAETVAKRAFSFSLPGLEVRPAIIDGTDGWLGILDGELLSAASVTVRDGRIATMNIIADVGYLHGLAIATPETD